MTIAESDVLNCPEIFPPYVTWEVISDCNHKCIYCYNKNDVEIQISNANADGLRKIADFIISRKPVDVTISGGEPLIHFEDIQESIGRFRRENISVRFNTNGSLITEDIAKYCHDNQVRLLISFPDASITRFNQITGTESSYHSVLKGFELLYKYNVEFSINIVVLKLNLYSVYETAKFLTKNIHPASIFISRITMLPCSSPSQIAGLLDSGELDTLFDICVKLKRETGAVIKSCGGFPFCAFNSQEAFDLFAKSCGAGKNGYVITNSGDIKVCVRDTKVYGNVFLTSFEEIWASMEHWRDNSFLPGECRLCNVREICGGGCHITSKRVFDDYANIDINSQFNRIPVHFRFSKEKLPRKTYKSLYRVTRPLQVTKTSFGVRVSAQIKYLMLDEKTAEYLLNTDVFNLRELRSGLSINTHRARKLICTLLSTGIISGE